MRYWIPLWISFLASFTGQAFLRPEAQPFQIDARQQIEFHERQNLCIARGDVKAIYGRIQLSGQVLKIFFTGTERQRKIIAFEMRGKAQLQAPEGTVTAERLYYTVTLQQLEATGGNLSLKTPRYQLHAQKKLAYSHLHHRGEAVGNTLFIDQDRQLKADRLVAFFTPATQAESPLKEPGGQSRVLSSAESKSPLYLQRLYADGHVVVSEGQRISKADRAIYTPDKIDFFGHVALAQDTDFAMGDQGCIRFANKNAFVRLSSTQGVRILLTKPRELKKTLSSQKTVP